MGFLPKPMPISFTPCVPSPVLRVLFDWITRYIKSEKGRKLRSLTS
jgi:hypothetical protein